MLKKDREVQTYLALLGGWLSSRWIFVDKATQINLLSWSITLINRQHIWSKRYATGLWTTCMSGENNTYFFLHNFRIYVLSKCLQNWRIVNFSKILLQNYSLLKNFKKISIIFLRFRYPSPWYASYFKL